MTAVGSYAKVFLSWRQRPKYIDSDILTEALRQSKLEKRGLITYMNHISVLDDPMVWGMVPMPFFYTKGYMRWTLGADNICFISAPLNVFFSLGQTLSTKRFGVGPFQPALDSGVYLLEAGQWVHMFPEGFVHQPCPPHEATLRYFRWGVSRLVLEPERAPIVVPIYGSGLEHVFPEDKPKRVLGYGRNHKVIYKVGTPLPRAELKVFREKWRALLHEHKHKGYLPQELQEGDQARLLRSETALFLREKLLDVRREFGFLEEDSRLASPEFWHNGGVPVKGLSLEEKAEL